jgi:hypothetical protein
MRKIMRQMSRLERLMGRRKGEGGMIREKWELEG